MYASDVSIAAFAAMSSILYDSVFINLRWARAATFLTYYLSIKTYAGFSAYAGIFNPLLYYVIVVAACAPIALGIFILVIKILRYKHLVKKGKIIEDDDAYIPYEPISAEQ